MMKRRGWGGRVFSRMGAVVTVLVVSFGSSVELSVRETSLPQCDIPEGSFGVAIVAGADMCRLTCLCRAKPWYKPCQWQETTCLYQGGKLRAKRPRQHSAATTPHDRRRPLSPCRMHPSTRACTADALIPDVDAGRADLDQSSPSPRDPSMIALHEGRAGTEPRYTVVRCRGLAACAGLYLGLMSLLSPLSLRHTAEEPQLKSLEVLDSCLRVCGPRLLVPLRSGVVA